MPTLTLPPGMLALTTGSAGWRRIRRYRRRAVGESSRSQGISGQ